MAHHQGSTQPTVLVVDDVTHWLEFLREFLTTTEPSWRILAASTFDEAEQLLDTSQVDLVVADLVLEEHSGIQLLRHAKAKDPLTMFILVTGYSSKLRVEEAVTLGAFDWFLKESSELLGELLASMRSALALRAMATVAGSRNLEVMRRHFDPVVLSALEREPELIDLRPRTMTVAFWDIRGFSYLCEVFKDHPSVVSDFLSAYLQLATEAIARNEGILDKFIGDGVMALFGLTEEEASDGSVGARNGVMTAVALRASFAGLLREWNPRFRRRAPQHLNLGLGSGIHTGEVLVGMVRTLSRDQFTAIGPHVNLASRLESLAEAGEILISTPTQVRVNEFFDTEPRNRLNNIKNIPGAFDVHNVVSAKPP